MNWLSSLFIAFLSGVLGLFCTGGISLLCVEWYRVSSFEGKSGYFVILTAILGGPAAFVIGLIAARWFASDTSLGFLKGLGVASGGVLGISIVALALCRLGADLAPELDGKSLVLMMGMLEPAERAKFDLRYRVRTVEPEPPPLNPAEMRAQEFSALEPDASLEHLLPFLFEGPTPERTAVVVKAVAERQPELATLVLSRNEAVREYALRAVTYATQPAPELVEAVLAEGRAIADCVRRFNELPETDPNYNTPLRDLSSRFNDWKHAWWTISQRIGVDGRPPLQEIRRLAAVRTRDPVMHEIEVNARYILDELNKVAEDKSL